MIYIPLFYSIPLKQIFYYSIYCQAFLTEVQEDLCTMSCPLIMPRNSAWCPPPHCGPGDGGGEGHWVRPQTMFRLCSSLWLWGRPGGSTEWNRREVTWLPFWAPQGLFHPTWPIVSFIGGGTAISPTCWFGSTPQGWPHSSSIQASLVLCWSNSKVLTPNNCSLPPHLEPDLQPPQPPSSLGWPAV